MIIVRKSQIEALEKKRRRSNLQMLLCGITAGFAMATIIVMLFTPYDGKTVRTQLHKRSESLMGQIKNWFPCCCQDECCDESCCCNESNCCTEDESNPETQA